MQAKALPTMCDHLGNVKVGKEILPPMDTKRWTAGRKMDILTAIKHKVINLAQLWERYNLTAAELLEWSEGFGERGLSGLKATKIRAA